MNPQVEAALIAGIVSLISLGGTVIVAAVGFRTTRSVTRSTLAEERVRTLNERFATAADKLGSDKLPAVQLAGVYAMAGLADDWSENRQTCVDVLCAYMRLPYASDPGDDASAQEQLDFHASREVRHTVIRVIAAHLREGAPISWQGLNFDFTGAVFDGGDFSGAEFSGGEVDFTYAKFPGRDLFQNDRHLVYKGYTDFTDAKFSGSTISFHGTEFSSGGVVFRGARFSGGMVRFFSLKISGGTVDFGKAEFYGGYVGFIAAEFSGGDVRFIGAKFSGSEVDFDVDFSGSTISFYGTEFSGGTVDFTSAEFSGGTVDFSSAKFSGGTVDFSSAEFSGGTVDFSNTSDWSHPPEFEWHDRPPPAGVKLPAATS